MNTLNAIFAADIEAKDIWSSKYDLVIVSLGYEERSSYLARKLTIQPNLKFALGFDGAKVLSYAQNSNQLHALGYNLLDPPPNNIVKWLHDQILNNKPSNGKTHTICIDVSSVTRSRLSHFLQALVTSASQYPLEVDFVYTVAKYSPPSDIIDGVTVCGPVSSYLAGWPEDPDKPVAAVIGLGYEYQKAVGALEFLEPTAQVLVRPVSPDHRFDSDIDRANSELLNGYNNAEVFTYPILNPTQCLELLDALFYRLGDDYRTIAIPFGPKIFALCSMLVALRYYPNIGVWRISSKSSADNAKEQFASDLTVGLKVRFDAPRAS